MPAAIVAKLFARVVVRVAIRAAVRGAVRGAARGIARAAKRKAKRAAKRAAKRDAKRDNKRHGGGAVLGGGRGRGRVRVDVQVSSRLPAIAASLEPMIMAAVAETVDEIADAARARAPVDTGALRDSIDGVSDGLEGAVIVGAFYGSLVEFGSASEGARPFLVPAAEAARARFATNVAAAIRLAAG